MWIQLQRRSRHGHWHTVDDEVSTNMWVLVLIASGQPFLTYIRVATIGTANVP